jgi:hypothetical protein
MKDWPDPRFPEKPISKLEIGCWSALALFGFLWPVIMWVK